MVELHVLLEPRGIVGGVILKPDPVEVETRIAPPSESLKGAAARVLGENPARPPAVRKPVAKVADFDSVKPDRMLAVRGADRIIEPDHMLHARPLTGFRLHSRIIEEEIPPVPSVSRDTHVHPIVVVIEAVCNVVLLSRRAEPVMTDGLDPRLGIRPGERRGGDDGLPHGRYPVPGLGP